MGMRVIPRNIRMARKLKYTGPYRAVRDLRCSTDEQGQGDYTTLDVQDADTKRYVEEKGYVDCGSVRSTVTGTTLKRPDWQKVYAMAQAGEIDVVVTTYRSRLGRGDACNAAELLLKDCGVRVEHVYQVFSDDSKGRTEKAVDGLVDGLYVEKVRETTTTMNGMFRDGFVVGHLSFGYAKRYNTPTGTWDGEGKKPLQHALTHPTNSLIVLHAFERLRDTREIARVNEYLNRVTDEQWSTTKTKALLRDESYCGVYSFGKRRKEDGLPVIVARSLFEDVQKILDGIEVKYTMDRTSVCQDYTYYLHQRVYCPFCECQYTNAAAKGGAVRYYVCNCDNKQRKICPIKRMNCNALHDSVLREIRRAADHHTVMLRVIAESGGWGKADDSLRSERNDLSLKKQSLEMRIKNYVKRIGEGKDSPAITAALDQCEAELGAVEQLFDGAEAAMNLTTIKRPTAAEIQAVWAEFLELWEEGTEAERKTLMARFVRRVEVTGKNKASLQIVGTIAGTPDVKFALQAKVGAVSATTTTFNPSSHDVPLFIPHGGKCRKKVPRPEQL